MNTKRSFHILQAYHAVFVVDTEVIDHHIDREHPHDDLIDDYGNIPQMDLCILTLPPLKQLDSRVPYRTQAISVLFRSQV